MKSTEIFFYTKEPPYNVCITKWIIDYCKQSPQLVLKHDNSINSVLLQAI